MDYVKWGFIGCGRVVQQKSGKAFNDVPNSIIHAIMRRNLDEAKKSAEMFGAKHWYDNIHDIANSDVDAIYIATPPGLHFEQALACCEAGKPVYVEKPLARNYTEAKQIVDAFESKGIPLFIGHYKRALPKFQYIKNAIDKGTIGNITLVRSYLNRIFSQKEADETWLYNPRLSGGGKFYDIAAHSMDIIAFLFGDITEIHGFATNSGTSCPLEDTVAFAYKTKNGILGTANFNCIANTKEDRMFVCGTKGMIEFSIHGTDDVIITQYETKTKEKFVLPDPKNVEYSMVEAVVKALITNQEGLCTTKEALSTYWAIDQVLDSFYHGRQREFWKDYEDRDMK